MSRTSPNAADGFLTIKELCCKLHGVNGAGFFKVSMVSKQTKAVNKGGKFPHSPLRRIHHFKRTHGLIETADLEPRILLFLHSINWRRGVLLNHIAAVAGGVIVAVAVVEVHNGTQLLFHYQNNPVLKNHEKSSCFAALKLHEISS